MAIQTALRLELAHRPGEFARVTRQLADAGVNIRTVAGLTAGGIGVVELLPDNLAAAEQALTQGGTTFREVQVVVAPLPQGTADRPGDLARLAEALSGAGISIESLYSAIGPGGQPLGVLGCSDPDKAEPLLASWGG